MKTANVRKTGKLPSYIIYAFLWLFFLIIPVITNNYWNIGEFSRIKYDWLRLLPFLVVFLVNSNLLLPKILFAGHTKFYLIVLLLTVSLITVGFQLSSPMLFQNDPDIYEQRLYRDPQYGREEMRPGISSGNVPGNTEIFSSRIEPARTPANNSDLIQGINIFLISLLVAGFNTAIATTNRLMAEEQSRKEAEKEHIRTELTFLQNQVSPHFFMNTLNNIHALIDADHDLAQDAILKLSGLMRYLLYESGKGTTTLKKEIEFLKSYINLMQLRVDKNIEINTDFPEVINDIKLPPLLFVSFIENAFKHGVSYREHSSFSFSILQNDYELVFVSTNTIPQFIDSRLNIEKGGIGLENIKKRLDLLYGKNYSLQLNNTGHEFIVKLTIPSTSMT
ncbi:MAG TPA: histidine kinase [Bacteroidales bacterium]|nr:histidine kinase [Bacteroidales bacterium]